MTSVPTTLALLSIMLVAAASLLVFHQKDRTARLLEQTGKKDLQRIYLLENFLVREISRAGGCAVPKYSDGTEWESGDIVSFNTGTEKEERSGIIRLVIERKDDGFRIDRNGTMGVWDGERILPPKEVSNVKYLHR